MTPALARYWSILMSSNAPMLTELEQDLIGELFNLGVGQAAASLSEMVQQEVKLSVPSVEFISVAELSDHLGENQTICSVSQIMEGPFSGRSLLLFPEDAGIEVVRRMLGAHLSDDDITNLQQEALSEVGNVVLNACIGSFAQAVNQEFKIGLPEYALSKPKDLLTETGDEKEIVMFLKISLTLSESEITGYLAFLLGTISLQHLHLMLSEMVENL